MWKVVCCLVIATEVLILSAHGLDASASKKLRLQELVRDKRSVGSRGGRVPCIDKEEFYRNPVGNSENVWSLGECSKYYLCLNNEVFAFKCSVGLLFDVNRQICDFKSKVFNCDITYQETTPKPLLDIEDHTCGHNEFGCADGTCLSEDFFCDGHTDCNDGSDEGWCDAAHDPNGAPQCNFQNCTLPDCFCSRDGTLIPGNLERAQTPQIITITFDDAVNYENWKLYRRIFGDDNSGKPIRTNPNGCRIHATFYISHEYTNYQFVQKLWNEGSEIAVHSITHRGPESYWSNNATTEDWFDEFVGQANIINKFAGVSMEDMQGLRVPFLRVGWNRQFIMMQEFGFVYDSSMAAPYSKTPIWPYTLDYKMPHPCIGTNQRCPSRSFPGIWELPLNELRSGEYTCSMMDQCPSMADEEEVYKMLMDNFNHHYNSNRAPLGLYFHTIWFKTKHFLRGFERFLDEVQSKSDVWILNNQELIEWMKNPTPSTQLTGFEPWKCSDTIPLEDVACNIPNSCKLKSRAVRGERWLHTCFECPEVYPWLQNEFGIEDKKKK